MLEGDPGKLLRLQKHPPKPAAPTAGDLACPAYLDRYGREEWRRIIGQAVAMGYAALDMTTLAMACDTYSEWRRARAKCRDRVVRTKVDLDGKTKITRTALSGLVQESGPNGLVPSAWYRIVEESKRAYLRFVGELGLSPAARTRIDAEPLMPATPAQPPKTGTDGKGRDPGRFFDA